VTSEVTREYLILIRTPFQAWLAEKVIEAESVVSFDLLYFTQNASAEDHFYYSRLAKKSRDARFVYFAKQVPDILNHLRLAFAVWPFVFGRRYDATMVSSIDSYVFNAIANRRFAGELVTFDDGTANYNKSGVYFQDSSALKARLYTLFFGATSVKAVRTKIDRHYTTQSNMDNIVDRDRLYKVSAWEDSESPSDSQLPPRVYFIGAPFEEFLDSRKIELLESRVRDMEVSVYVKHPRENNPLELGVPFLEKSGKIAEEAILEDASCQPIVLIGSLSSVMFNMANRADRRIVFVPDNTGHQDSFIELARRSGCEIEFI